MEPEGSGAEGNFRSGGVVRRSERLQGRKGRSDGDGAGVQVDAKGGVEAQPGVDEAVEELESSQGVVEAQQEL